MTEPLSRVPTVEITPPPVDSPKPDESIQETPEEGISLSRLFSLKKKLTRQDPEEPVVVDEKNEEPHVSAEDSDKEAESEDEPEQVEKPEPVEGSTPAEEPTPAADPTPTEAPKSRQVSDASSAPKSRQASKVSAMSSLAPKSRQASDASAARESRQSSMAPQYPDPIEDEELQETLEEIQDLIEKVKTQRSLSVPAPNRQATDISERKESLKDASSSRKSTDPVPSTILTTTGPAEEPLPSELPSLTQPTATSATLVPPVPDLSPKKKLKRNAARKPFVKALLGRDATKALATLVEANKSP